MSALTLYHGSNVLFETVDLSKSRDRRDFGCGFYTTTIREQAEHWAKSLFTRYGGAGRFVYVFEFNNTGKLATKEFDGLTLEWLEMVKENRIHGSVGHAFDMVRGPVANDNTMPTIALYVDGTLSVEAALTQLAFYKVSDQLSFHTPNALACLKLVERLSL